MSKFFTVLTKVGEAKLANATALGQTVQFEKLAIGDGNGALPVPDQNQTQLVNEVRRMSLNSVEIDENNPNWIICEQVIPEDVGGWTIREVGIYDVDGDLIAVGNFPETYKPILEEGSGRTQTVRVVLQVSATATVELKIDPSVVLATRQYVDIQDQKHEAKADPHPQYVIKKIVDGIKTVLIEGGVNQSVRFEIAESGQLGFSLFYNGADDNATYIQSNIFGAYRNLVKIPREVARWDFLAPAYYSGYQLLDKSFVASPAEVIAGSTTKVATGEGVLAALAKAHSNGMLSPTGSYVFPKDENGLSLIIQWGIDSQITGQGSGDKTVVLPITFPNGIFLALTTPGMIGATSGDCVGYVAGNQTNFTYNWNSNNATGFEVSWFALGY
ncbi:phage tail protein [Vibrio furnissii]|uniref:phage tail protein n=1 Tax=Vibrio furnissii TaxID=29494 RepID=UPI0012AEACB1|nr:phage tail protein [Vibrio furnissii]